VRLGEIGRRQCLRIQDLGSEFRRPKTKVPTKILGLVNLGLRNARWQFNGAQEVSSGTFWPTLATM